MELNELEYGNGNGNEAIDDVNLEQVDVYEKTLREKKSTNACRKQLHLVVPIQRQSERQENKD